VILVTTITALSNCPVCKGTGFDDDFGSPCNCRLIAAALRNTSYPEPAPQSRSPRGEGGGRGTSKPSVDPTLIAWLAEQTWSEFAQSLAKQHARTGSLSPNQIASASGMRAKCEAKRPKATAPATVAAPAVVTAPVDEDPLDLSKVPSGLYAVPGGDTRLKVQIDNVRTGKWDGWVFVKDAAVYGEGRRYGSQKPGAYYRGQIEAALRVIAADPMAASAAYGHLTSTCGRCGRPLEKEESVARGIGPDCAGKAWSL